MNCDEFLSQMHECIDQQLPIESDAKLQDHVDHCSTCRSQWNAWTEISTAFAPLQVCQPARVEQAPVSDQGFRKSHVRLGLSLAVAMTVLFVFANRHPDGTDSVAKTGAQSTDSFTGVERPVGAAILGAPEISSGLHPEAAAWWQDVQQRDWLAQTMPAVLRVRNGVAPYGRTLLQAVSILTVGGGEKTS